MGSENFGSKKDLDPKKFGLRKIFWTGIIFDPENFRSRNIWVPKNFGFQIILGLGIFWSTSNVQTKLVFMLDMSLDMKLFENELGGGWVVYHRNIATPWSNLQVRTCKMQAKLDSKLDPSVAIRLC